MSAELVFRAENDNMELRVAPIENGLLMLSILRFNDPPEERTVNNILSIILTKSDRENLKRFIGMLWFK